MKKLCLILCMLFSMTGCSTQTFLETVMDVYVPNLQQDKAKVQFDLPQDAAMLTSSGSGDCLYMGEGYEIVLETFHAGDLGETLSSVTGFDQKKLTILELPGADYHKYYTVWSTVGEYGDSVGKCMILDDGVYHYCLSVITDADYTQQLEEMTKNLFASYSATSY